MCNRRKILFWNHEACTEYICPVTAEKHGACQTCRHCRGEICALTRAALPEAESCCHWNVDLLKGLVRVTPAMAAPLVGFFDAAKNVIPEIPRRVVDGKWVIPVEHRLTLDELGIPYRVGEQGLYVDPESLVLVIDEPIPAILESLEAPYQLRSNTECWIDPDQLGLPVTFGYAVEY